MKKLITIALFAIGFSATANAGLEDLGKDVNYLCDYSTATVEKGVKCFLIGNGVEAVTTTVIYVPIQAYNEAAEVTGQCTRRVAIAGELVCATKGAVGFTVGAVTAAVETIFGFFE